MKFNFTRFPAELEFHSTEGDCDYRITVFGEIKLSWGMDFYVFRMGVRQSNGIEGVGEVRLLLKDEFDQFFDPFNQVPQPDLQ